MDPYVETVPGGGIQEPTVGTPLKQNRRRRRSNKKIYYYSYDNGYRPPESQRRCEIMIAPTRWRVRHTSGAEDTMTQRAGPIDACKYKEIHAAFFVHKIRHCDEPPKKNVEPACVIYDGPSSKITVEKKNSESSEVFTRQNYCLKDNFDPDELCGYWSAWVRHVEAAIPEDIGQLCPMS